VIFDVKGLNTINGLWEKLLAPDMDSAVMDGWIPFSLNLALKSPVEICCGELTIDT